MGLFLGFGVWGLVSRRLKEDLFVEVVKSERSGSWYGWIKI